MAGRGLEEAIRALALTPKIRLRLIGPGRKAYRQGLGELARQEGVADRVEIQPAVPQEQLVAAIADADFGLMLIQPICLSYELTLPNKLFEYAAAGLPVLGSDLPVIGQMVEEHGLGRVVPPTDVAQIAQAMRELSDLGVGSEIGGRVRAFAQANTWEHERGALEAVYLPQAPSEQSRVERDYAAYAGSSVKRRSWDSANPGNAAIRAELVQVVLTLAADELREAREILDAGCGTGWWLQELDGRAEITARLCGVDLLPERVAAATRRVPRASISVADVRSLPLAADSFDMVTLFTVLSSLRAPDDIRRAVGEARRVLRPGGALLIWEPRVPNPLNRRTRFLSAGLLQRALAGMDLESRTTTLLPPLARRLDGGGTGLYPWLVRLGPLRTHRLLLARDAATPRRPR
jgi:SAM-dependent methyltransferase